MNFDKVNYMSGPELVGLLREYLKTDVSKEVFYNALRGFNKTQAEAIKARARNAVDNLERLSGGMNVNPYLNSAVRPSNA